jgi:response regulator RpfG family c-di-GMP phosphodiesterase
MMSSRVNSVFLPSTAGPSGPDTGATQGGSAFEVLLATLSACAPETYAHSRRVMLSAVATARTMELPASIVEQIEQASLLHDLGKLAMTVPDAAGAGPQAELQAVLVRQHVRIGFDVLSVVPHLRPVASAVIAVHERWDGFGYPAGLRGTEIPVAARVIAVADAFDVLTTAHRYHRGMTRDEANAEIVRGAGTYFDPDIVRVWLRTSDRLECS